MPSRRQWLSQSVRVAGLLLSSGAWPVAQAQEAAYNAAAFDAKSVADAMKALGLSMPVASTDVQLTAPDIAENGAVVPVALAATVPGVRRLLLLVEKNPATLSADFSLSDAVDASLVTRVKMAESSMVHAVAITVDGRVLVASKDVKVTLGGCGG